MNNLNLSPLIGKKTIEVKPVRDGFADGILAAAEIYPNLCVLTADLKDSTRVKSFAEKYPERFIEVGVAEQALITVASGMSQAGVIPVATSFSVFSPGRNWEQIRTTIAINDAPVIIAGFFVGVSVGFDGATHQMLEDISLMRSLPNMIVLAPSDTHEVKKALLAAIKIKKPVYIRIPRVESPVYTSEETPYEIGKALVLSEVKDPMVTIISHGTMVYESLMAAEALNKVGMSTNVVNCHTIKPLDTQTILRQARSSRVIVVAEEHQKAGGLGSAIAEYLSQVYPIHMEIIAVDDKFGQSGEPKELLKAYRLTRVDIVAAAKAALKRSKNN